MTERTLCIFKPDLAANEQHTASALIRLLAIGLLPVQLVRATMTIAQAVQLYAAHDGQPYHRANVDFVASGPSVIMLLEGVRAVDRLREIVGTTDPLRAQPGTLRRMFGTELPRNAVHATATVGEVENEIRIFFVVR